MPRNVEQAPETLHEFLASDTVSELKKLLPLVTDERPTRKADICATIEAVMLNPKAARSLWDGLDSTQQAAVSETLYDPSLTFHADQFRAKHGKLPDWNVSSKAEEDDHAFGFSDWYDRGAPTRLNLFIFHQSQLPRDLAQCIQPFVPKPKNSQMESISSLPHKVTVTWEEYNYSTAKRDTRSEAVEPFVCETAQTAQTEFISVLRLIDAGKVRVSEKTQRVTAAGARAVTDVLVGGDFYQPNPQADEWETEPGAIRAFAWPLIVQGAKLASSSSGKLQLTSTGKKALMNKPHQTLKQAWNRWLKTKLLDEFNRVTAIKGQTGKGKRYLTAVAKRRAVIVGALESCPPGQWVQLSEFSRYMRAAGHRFEVTSDPWTLYIAEAGYGALSHGGYHDWNILQERYILAFLFEYAATMGLIDVAYIHPSGARKDFHEMWGTDDLDCLSIYDGLLYFRINPFGAWILGLVEEYVPLAVEAEAVLKILPNRDLVATQPLSAGDAIFVEQFANQASDNVWKIDEQKLLQMVESGRTVKEVEQFLSAKNDGKLPQNVAVLINDIRDRTSQLTPAGSALLIAVEDAGVAKRIAHERSLQPLCMLAGENHIVVPYDKERAFRRALRQMGYALPAAE